MEFVWLE